ncbi:MAG TPA: Rrf2 family transcriptional regulator [Acetobacteraceae bacterium]|nr:Rrf2 family transcriptional regulator [Acetobacteraceae bacterium]
MRLMNFTDFGLRVLMLLGAAPERTRTTEDLARALGISRNHLVKVLQHLAASGYVHTMRGAGGGVRLARPAASIRLGEVVAWLERGQPLVECFRADGGACPLTPCCRLRGALSRARAAFLESLNGETLAECIMTGL